MEIEQIKEDREIAKQEITQAIDKLTSKHENVSFEIYIENKTLDYLDDENKKHYHIVHIEAKI